MNIRTDTNNLRSARAQIDHIIANYATWHRWIASLLPDGYPSGIDFNPTSKGGITDPTGRTALSRQRDANLLAEASRLTQQLDDIANRLAAILDQGPRRVDTDAIARAARCSGAVDPTCQRLADGRRHKTGLCDACWQAQYRAAKQMS